MIEKGFIDAVAFGRSYIANPDLVERFRQHAPLNEPKPESFYGGGAEGIPTIRFWRSNPS